MTISESVFDVINTAKCDTGQRTLGVRRTSPRTSTIPGPAPQKVLATLEWQFATADELRPHAVALLRKLARHAASRGDRLERATRSLVPDAPRAPEVSQRPLW